MKINALVAGFFFGDKDRFFLRNVQKFLCYIGQHDRKIFKRYQEIANKFCKAFCLNLFKKSSTKKHKVVWTTGFRQHESFKVFSKNLRACRTDAFSQHG